MTAGKISRLSTGLVESARGKNPAKTENLDKHLAKKISRKKTKCKPIDTIAQQA
jgi:hypothetical protein